MTALARSKAAPRPGPKARTEKVRIVDTVPNSVKEIERLGTWDDVLLVREKAFEKLNLELAMAMDLVPLNL